MVAIDTFHPRPRSDTYDDNIPLFPVRSVPRSSLPFDCCSLDDRAEYRQDARRAGGGFVNHDLFWNVLSPWGGHPPSQDSDTIQVRRALVAGFVLVRMYARRIGKPCRESGKY